MANDVAVRIIKNLAQIVQQTKPKAVVLPWWVLAQGLGESVPQLSSMTEDEWGAAAPYRPWVHAYMFGIESMPREKTGHPKVKDTVEIRLWAFYGWKLGDANKNSEFVFATHVKDVQDAITLASKLQTDPADVAGVGGTGVREVTGHGEWQVDRMGTYWFGKQKVHVAQGTIEVYANLLLPATPLQP